MWESPTDGHADAAVHAWARAGLMALTGPAERRGLGPPAPFVPGVSAIADLLHARSAALGSPVLVDPLALVAERAAIAGLTRHGRVSCGGGTRLLRTNDGWLAISLARSDDIELVPAWLGLDATPDDAWPAVAEHVATQSTASLVAQARLLGLPVGALPSEPLRTPCPPPPLTPLPYRAERFGERPATSSLAGLVVADLSALWAGPLCGALLSDAGATVVKVESTRRPDGARGGPQASFDLLNAGKRSVAVDFADAAGRRVLEELLTRADVVIEASRPRALEQLGIDAHAVLRTARPRVWLSITAHGRDPEHRDRVGFGDDAAVAGGLVVWDRNEPFFCADAVADPTTGLVAATAVLDALAAGGSWLLDVSLSGVAAHLSGPTLRVPDMIRAAAPTPRPPRGTGPTLGADTEVVLHDLEIHP